MASSNERTQHALVLTLMELLGADSDDIIKAPASPIMHACGVFLPLLLGIVTREHPQASCR